MGLEVKPSLKKYVDDLVAAALVSANAYTDAEAAAAEAAAIVTSNAYTDVEAAAAAAAAIVTSNAYTDANVKRFGAWLDRANNTVYQAATEGFVIAYSSAAETVDILGLTDGSNPPATTRIRDKFLNTFGGQTGVSGIMMPVKKDDYWKVTGAATVYWIPLEP